MKQTITLLFFAVFTTLLSAQTVSIQGGSSYATITAAITAAVDGDVILISGIFTEPITIAKSITLRGTNPATDIIQAAASPGTGGTGSRVINIGAATAAALNVTVENLTIRNGNFNANGGGINVDKVTGLVALNNLIITNNHTTTNGGALGIAGANVNVTNCLLESNTAITDGGAIIAAPNNGAAVDNIVNIKQTLINNNTGRNGGGIYINGNLNFGNTYKIAVNIENSTIASNTATSIATGNGGGAILSLSQPLLPASTTGNVTISLVHVTMYNNFHAGLTKAGIQFLAPTATTPTNFSAYNSIIVGNDDVTVTGTKAINFANSNTTKVVNCILGGTNLPPTIVSDPVPNANNNEAGKTATYAGLDVAGGLQDLGGKTKVLPLLTATKAVNFCTAATGISIPTIDQRGYTKTGAFDAGAFELGATLSVDNKIYNANSVDVYPNPASNRVNIKSLNAISKINIYDVSGKQVFKSNVNSKNDSIDISNLSRGIHLMVIESEGQKTVKRLIVK